MAKATTPQRRSLPTKIVVYPSGVRRIVTFTCPGCHRRHTHHYRGPHHYLPKCPRGTGYWKSAAGYWLQEEGDS